MKEEEGPIWQQLGKIKKKKDERERRAVSDKEKAEEVGKGQRDPPSQLH